MKPEELIKLLKDPNDRSGNDVDMESVMETIIQALEKQVLTERAISAFIGQAGENDGYLGCYMVHRQNHQHCQTGDTVESLDELIEWYKENFPEEIDWSEE